MRRLVINKLYLLIIPKKYIASFNVSGLPRITRHHESSINLLLYIDSITHFRRR